MQRLDLVQGAEPVMLAPGEEAAGRMQIRRPRVPVADRHGEEFKKPCCRGIAGVGNGRRHHDRRRDRARQSRRIGSRNDGQLLVRIRFALGRDASSLSEWVGGPLGPDGLGCVWPTLVGGRCAVATSRARFCRFFGTLTGHRRASLREPCAVFLRPRRQERIVSLCSRPWSRVSIRLELCPGRAAKTAGSRLSI